jgi:murein DD-endopeptidase MepM/ murein hydrolase activator NlpD
MLRWMFRGLFVTMAVAAFALGHARVAPGATPAQPHVQRRAGSAPLAPDRSPVTPVTSRVPTDIVIPVEGVPASALKDSFDEGRVGHVHHAIDILAPRGTAVVAAVDGPIRKLFTSAAGGLTIYQFDRAGELLYYYAHLDRYAPGIAEGMDVPQGTVIGYVGTSGNAPPGTPHLHFAIERLGPEKLWWRSEPINPYPILMTRASTPPERPSGSR